MENALQQKIYDTLTKIQDDFHDLKSRIQLIEERASSQKIERLTEQVLTLTNWKSAKEAQDAVSKTQSFTWIHALGMLLIGAVLNVGTAFVISGKSEPNELLIQKIDLLEKKIEAQAKREDIKQPEVLLDLGRTNDPSSD